MSSKSITLVHLTDLHFGGNAVSNPADFNFSPVDIAKLVVDKVKDDFSNRELVIALGGDITDRGNPNKYQYAIDFVQWLTKGLRGHNIKFMLCPGNHDTDTKQTVNKFNAFNKFAYDVTKSDKYIFNDIATSVAIKHHGWSLISTNSLHHGNKDYGFLDLDGFEKTLNKWNLPVVVLTHHHLIPIYDKDISVCRNSYGFFKLCLNNRVKLILHGHVHSSLKLDIANSRGKTKIIGSGALLPEIGPNYNNQFNIIELDNQKISRVCTYRIHFDNSKSHKPIAIKEHI